MDTTTIVDAYLAGPDELRLAVADMSRDQLVARPIPGKWSVLEVVCHLADTEANIAHRLKTVLAEDRPEFERVQPDRLLAALAYHSREPDEEISRSSTSRAGRSPVSCRISPARGLGTDGDRSKNAGRGPSAQMLNGAVEHLKHHLAFIIEKRHALGLGDPGR